MHLKCSYEFITTKRTLKTVLRMVLRTCKTVSIRQCINREAKSKSSQFSYSVAVYERTMKFLVVVTSPYIYHG